MCFEHAPWRKKGLYTGITQAGFPVGLLLANLAFLISVPLGGQWAWRVPFLLSAVLIVVGILIRLKLEESPEFEELKDEGEISKNPLLEVLRNDWRNVLRAFFLRIAETAGYAVSVTFVLSYLAGQELADRPVILTGAHGRGRPRHRGDHLLGRPHRPRRAAAGVPVRHGGHRAVGHPAVPGAEHRRGRGDRGGLRHQLRRLPELPRRRPGGVVLRAVRDQDPHHRRLAGLPAVRGGLRVHPAGGDGAVRRLRLDRPGPAAQRLRPARPDRRRRHPRHVGTGPARGGRRPRARTARARPRRTRSRGGPPRSATADRRLLRHRPRELS